MNSTSTTTRNELTRSTPAEMLAAATARGGLTEIHILAEGQSRENTTPQCQRRNLDRFVWEDEDDKARWDAGRGWEWANTLPDIEHAQVWTYRGFWIVADTRTPWGKLRTGRGARVFA